jgi:hypothetical protein
MITLDDIDANVKPIIWGDTHSKRIAELEAQIAALTAERDAAYLALIDIDHHNYSELVMGVTKIAVAAMAAAKE